MVVILNWINLGELELVRELILAPKPNPVCVATLLDGFGWRPLSTEWDYAKTVERVRSELFAEEMQSLLQSR